MNFVQNLAIRFERFVELVYAKRVSQIKLVTRLALFWTKSILVGGQLNAPAYVHIVHTHDLPRRLVSDEKFGVL